MANQAMAKTAGIYRIRNTQNGKVYIGQTANLSARWRTHIHRLRALNHDNPHLQAAWTFYGEKAFVYEIIKACGEDDLNQEEMREIAAVAPDMIYNIFPGGGQTNKGRKFSKQRRLDHSRARGGKAFFAVNLRTGEITPYEYTTHAEESDKGFRATTIAACLRGQIKTHNGHSFHHDYGEAQRVAADPESWIPQNPLSREITGTCIATGETRHYKRIGDVRPDGFNRASVSRCLRGQNMFQHNGWSWKYADGQPHQPMAEDWRRSISQSHAGGKPVEGTSAVTGEVVVFKSLSDAASHFDCHSSAIHHALRKPGRQSARHTWRYITVEDFNAHKRSGSTEVLPLHAIMNRSDMPLSVIIGVF